MALKQPNQDYRFVPIPAFLYHEPLGFSVEGIKDAYRTQLQYDVDRHRRTDKKTTYISLTSSGHNQFSTTDDTFFNSLTGVSAKFVARIKCG